MKAESFRSDPRLETQMVGNPIRIPEISATDVKKPAPRLFTTPDPATLADQDGYFEVRPIGTARGMRELAQLHKRSWAGVGIIEKRVLAKLWPMAQHFGLYLIRRGEEQGRPPIVGAFWARSLAEAPLTVGHLYPPELFKGLLANDIFEFGGLVIDPAVQKRGLAKALADAARLFIFSRRPELLITNPVEVLYPIYKSFGLKTIGDAPVDYPYLPGAKVWVMYARFKDLAAPYFM
jgi:ribosomal protein S18 acetylase RimI-like enzyme